MPLSELYRMAKGKLDSSQDENPTCSTDLSFVPENDFVEVVWENGQLLMQGQSSRTRKSPGCNSLPSHILPSHSPKFRDKDIGNGFNSKFGKCGTMDSVLNEFPVSVPSGEMGLGPDDDMVPWLNYPIDDSLHHGYCSDFLPELSGVTVNDISNRNNFSSIDKRSSGNQTTRDTNTLSLLSGVSFEQGNGSKVSSARGGQATRPRAITSQLFSSSSQPCQASFPSLRSDVSDNTGNSTAHHAVSRESTRVPTSAVGFPGIKMQKRYPVPPNNNSGLMNFSHFARPAALVKANLQNIGAMAASGLSNVERTRSKDKESAASSSNIVESTLNDSSSGLRETISHSQPIMVPSKVDEKQLDAKPLEEPLSAKQSEAIPLEDASKNEKNPNQNLGESATRGLQDGEKNMEPVVATSSVCSGNSVERASDDPIHNLKRKCIDTEESECPSEDAEEETVGAKKAALARGGSGSKRSRAAEVHNLSERRRRDRINEKMRALQELIPNCNKVDKASMLDEAIEYLKTLQLQVQIMSMGAGLYMPPLMFPTGMQHMHAAHMAHFPPMGVGMGMSYGMGIPDMNGGSSGCPMIQVPPMQGLHFPGPSMSGTAAMHGMAGSNIQLFGLPGQGFPMSMPRAPLIPLSGGPLMKSTMGLNARGMVGAMENLDSAVGSSSKDPMQNINSQGVRNTGANSSMNQTSSQGQATNEGFEQPALMQNNGQASDANGTGAVDATN